MISERQKAARTRNHDIMRLRGMYQTIHVIGSRYSGAMAVAERIKGDIDRILFLLRAESEAKRRKSGYVASLMEKGK